VNINSFVLEGALKQLQLPKESIRQFKIASALSDVEGSGFPKELFQLSAPLVVRGLLNFAILQMKRDWIYPFWVHRQLDPSGDSYIPRSQNPLLLNVTHRNWTAIGSLNGLHEAIVDPRGLVTPLPREWSVDVWIATAHGVFFPSLAHDVHQRYDTASPRLVTLLDTGELALSLEDFVGSTRQNLDVLFRRARITNRGNTTVRGQLCFALRPFNPEGVAPIQSIHLRDRRFFHVDNAVAVAFAQTPDWVICSNSIDGDSANILRSMAPGVPPESAVSASCPYGLANAVAAFVFELDSQEERTVDCSIALGDEKVLRQQSARPSWRVSFERRLLDNEAKWKQELEPAAQFPIADHELQNLFDASRLALLQLHDGNFISPGPFLYHHFWYRDSAPMVRALDLLGFEDRARQIIDAYPDRLTSEGFFRGPDGEWDSNGAVLWSVHQHYLLTRSRSWLSSWYSHLLRGAEWIARMRKRSSATAGSVEGLMPRSLSAEHLGTVDQYFWDSFWSLGGIQSFIDCADALGKHTVADRFRQEKISFEQSIRIALKSIELKLGETIIPSAPLRSFDESAIGSVSSVYPLHLLPDLPHPLRTVDRIVRDYCDEKGFFHPIIHSGYNPYLTLHLAHSYLLANNPIEAWRLADSVFRQAPSPYSMPEAIHPTTGGGVMGDGHHGWAAAEIILFLRDCMVRESEDRLLLFQGANERILHKGTSMRLSNVPTSFGTVNISVSFESGTRFVIQFRNNFFTDHRPASLEVFLPFQTRSIVSSSPQHIVESRHDTDSTWIACSSVVKTLFIEL
jgi:hypothetical protein